MHFSNPNPCDNLIDLVIDNYRLLSVVGQGGMGCVYKARDEKMGRIVALKVLRSNLGVFSSREGKALGQLNHPNIVNIFYMGESREGVFIAMEFVDGGTLHDHIGKDASEIIPIMKQTLLALEHAHDAGVIHRDIKPSNIMVSKRNQVKVMDFGLAKVDSRDQDRTVTRLQAGTISYMSPEQVRGLQHVSQQSDIYSLGKTFYHILAGRLPFNNSESDQYSILKAIIERQFKPPSHFKPEIPRGLDRIIMKAIQKDPEQRYQSAREMFVAIEEFEAKLKQKTAIHTRIAPSSIRPHLALDKKKIMIGIAATSLLLIITAMTAWYSNREPLPPQEQQSQTIALGEQAGSTSVDTRSGGPGNTASKDSTLNGSLPSGKPAFISVNATPATSTIRIGQQEFRRVVEDHSLQAGSHRLEVSADGYDTYSNTLRLNPEQDTTLSVTLRPQGYLIVGSNIPNARVSIDNRYIGTIPINQQFPRGNYLLTVNADGYPPFSRRVTVQSGNNVNVSATFEPQGMLRVQAIPDGDIYIDGRQQSLSGESEWFETSLPQGTHTVRVVHDEYGVWEKTVDLSDDGLNFTVDFTRKVEVNIGSNVFGSPIYIDGEKTNFEAPARINLNVGVRRIEVRKEGYTSDPPFIERLIEGTETGQVRLSFELSRSSQ